MQKGFASIFIVFVAVALIGLVGGAVYLAKQSPKPVSQPQTHQPSVAPSPTISTANWTVYTNSVAQFMLKYPK